MPYPDCTGIVRNYRAPIIILCIILCIPPSLLSSTNPLTHSDLHVQFDHFTYEEGLPAVSYRMIQDSLGFLWFGTSQGVYRYDGYSFKHYPITHDMGELGFFRCHGLRQDASGYIWICFRNVGIFKLDPRSGMYEHFYHNPDDSTTLSTNDIGGIVLDSHGFLWTVALVNVQSKEWLLDVLDTRTGKVRRIKPDTLDIRSPSSTLVKTYGLGAWHQIGIYEDSKSNIWLSTYGGVNRYNRQTNDFTRFNHDPEDTNTLSSDDVIPNILEDSRGNIWVGTNNGLNCLDSTNTVVSRFRNSPQISGVNKMNWVKFLFEDRDKNIWFSRQGGLSRINITGKSFTHYDHDVRNAKTPSAPRNWAIMPIYQDRFGAVWFLSEKSIDIYDPETDAFTRCEYNPGKSDGFHLQGYVFYYLDRSETMWIGSSYLIERVNPNANRIRVTRQRENGLLSNTVRCFLQSRNNPEILWVGHESGLSRLNLNTGRTRYYQNEKNTNAISSNAVRHLHEDKEGNLWIVTSAGLDKLNIDGKFKTYTLFPQEPGSLKNVFTYISEDSSGQIWICVNYYGLACLNPKTEKMNLYRNDIADSSSFSAEELTYCNYVDQKGRLWIGTDNGLDRYNPESDNFSHFLKEIPVKRIREDGQGFLWLLTFGSGICRFNPETGETRFWNDIDSPLKKSALDMVQDHSGIWWIGTKSGIFRFDAQTDSFSTVFTGISGYDLNCTGTMNNAETILWGTETSGLIQFKPDEMEINVIPPEIVISEIQIANETVEPGPESPLDQEIAYTHHLELDHDQNDVSFICASLHYVDPENNLYQFWLENYDSDWREAGTNRVATYTNLDPGKYIFHVKGANSDGVWNPEPRSLAIVIHPPWYQTLWAYVIYLFLISGVVILIWKNQLRRITLRNELKIKQVEAEKLAEIDHIKTRFLTNISHEFRTPLTLILGPIGQLLKQIRQREQVAELQIIKRNAQRLARLVNQLLDLSRIEAGKLTLKTRQDNLVPFLNRIVQSFESRARLKQIELTFETGKPTIQVYFDTEKMEHVFYNLIANALKFTPEQGSVKIRVLEKSGLPVQDEQHLNHGVVCIVVSDTGPGIPEDKLDKIFDRFYQVSNSETQGESGTGIGLALARELVSLHQGRLTVKSTVGIGSEFSVILPLGRDHLKNIDIVIDSPPSQVPDDLADVTIPRKEKEPAVKQAPMVLIIEDNRDLRHYIRSVLKNTYHTLEAENGKTGLIEAIDKLPDCIITDVMMPEMNGYELCEQLKTDERTSHIPVIMLTARADLDSKIEGLETGADDYCIKPFNETELKVRVSNLIEQRKKLRKKFLEDITLPIEKVSVTSADQRFLRRVMDITLKEIHNESIDADSFSREVGFSRSQLHRKLKALVNMSTTEFIRSIRLRRAAELLSGASGTVSEIAYEVGFNNPSYFSACFRKQFGCLPFEYKQTSNPNQTDPPSPS